MGVAFAVISAVLYSANYIFIQLGMRRSKDNGAFISLVSCCATLILLFLVSMILTSKEVSKPSGWVFFYFAAAGFFTAFLGRTSLFAGIRRIGSPRAASIKNAAPIFTIIVAVALLGENIDPLSGLGIFIVMGALLWQSYRDFIQFSGSLVRQGKIGIGLSVLSAVFFGLGQGARKQGISIYADPLAGALIGVIFALFSFMVSEIVLNRRYDTMLNSIKDINGYFILAGFVTALAQISFFISLLFINVSYTSVIAAIEPVVTVLLAKIFLRGEEKIDFQIVLTALLVFLGTVVIVLGK